ncbi:MAG: hypothetical protein AAF921_16025, partial [Cyanobacteria bacterium P01_D01_bin.44]
DEASQTTLARGQRIREVLKQHQYHAVPVTAQIALLLLLNGGCLDNCPLDKISSIETRLIEELPRRLPEICDGIASPSENRIQAGNPLAEDERQAIFTVAEDVRSQILANSPQTG